jgi:hypothetical protein
VGFCGGYGRVSSRDYAKAAGYLPGAHVSVASPAAKIMMDALILGALDGEGISILLSPESVKKLAIQKGSLSRVLLTKRSGWSERAARTAGELCLDADSGNAPLAKSRQRQAANSLGWQTARNAEIDKPENDVTRRCFGGRTEQVVQSGARHRGSVGS